MRKPQAMIFTGTPEARASRSCAESELAERGLSGNDGRHRRRIGAARRELDRQPLLFVELLVERDDVADLAVAHQPIVFHHHLRHVRTAFA